MGKATTASEARRFEDIPNIGPAMAKDFVLLGLTAERKAELGNR